MSTYKVIEILDEYTLIINYGFKHSAQKGDVLRIFTPGEIVKDPSTGEDLGTLDIIKETVQVVVPYEKFSTCKKISIREIEILNPLSNFMKKTITEKKLNVNENDISNRIVPESAPISIGDSAIVLPN